MNESSSEYILKTSREYAIYTCENRAIPKVTDGLKDAQRKALWLVRNKSDMIKTISLAGEMISAGLYLHGEQSAAGAISMLAAPYCNNIPLLQGIGNFGTRISPVEGIGAPRYTYVKKNKALSDLILSDLDIVPLKENYDGSAHEPIHFLPLIPTVLLNGISGIAVGWSTEILPRKLSDIIQASIKVLENKKVTKLIPSYEYLNVDVKHLIDNTWEFSGKLEIIDSNTLKVIELPPDITLEKFKDRLNQLEDENKIVSYVDRSTKLIDITIKFARGALKDKTTDDLIEFLKLKQKKSERIIVIDWSNDKIIQYESAEKLLIDFVNWRLSWFSVRYQNMKDNDSHELKFWRGIKECFDKKLPSRLPKKANKAEILEEIKNITKHLELDNTQLERIVSLPTYRWAVDAYQEVCNKINELENNIIEYETILNDPDTIRNIYKKELQNLNKIKF